MRANLGQIYDETITVVNKLDARDNAEKQDSYFKHILQHCMWSTRTTRSVEPDGTVDIGTTSVVQIPESENYLTYRAWSKGDKDQAFTIRAGDYIVKGVVTEEITAANVKKILAQYEPDSFQVQTFRDATKGEGFTHSTSGIMRFTEAYIVEG